MYRAIKQGGWEKTHGHNLAEPQVGGPPPAPLQPRNWILICTLDLPMPPSVNSCYFTGQHGRRVLTKVGKDWKALASLRTLAAAGSVIRLELDQWVKLEITVYVPLYYKNGKRRRFDASNRVKLLEDAVCAGLGIDDSAVLGIHAHKVDAAAESVGVEVWRST